MRARKKIHRMNETGRNGISSITSPGCVPPVRWRKMASYSKSPVVIVMVVTMDLPGVANEDRCNSTYSEFQIVKDTYFTLNVWGILLNLRVYLPENSLQGRRMSCRRQMRKRRWGGGWGWWPCRTCRRCAQTWERKYLQSIVTEEERMKRKKGKDVVEKKDGYVHVKWSAH